MPKYKVGDLVIQVADHYISDEEFGKGRTFDESPFGIGSIGVVKDVNVRSGQSLRVNWQDSYTGSVIATRSVKPYNPEAEEAEVKAAIESILRREGTDELREVQGR